ncbi:hypothetical protein [Alteromonas sp. a30]|uniref:hypothetical protein n=1 Tax=Alteromonas sp. a30 TaxID=2730917 RepID=UPI002281C2E3|nr:hypothetical protein [Alteromonas sp. a30]MCY7297253.1 hypothetical protein [Alteromonas sp. a30]
MSYLTYPRLHFSGGFRADPSTVNNTPNNFSGKNDETKDLELFWNPNGTGVFALEECVVTKVVYGPGDETSNPKDDPVIGQPVATVYSYAAPKMVDLDPCQMNVTEIWGMRVQVAGPSPSAEPLLDFVAGDYIEGSFNAIWAQALKGPRSSASGSGVYQSTLTNLQWNISSAPKSRFLAQLQQQSPSELSINIVLNAHNNAPQLYAFNNSTFELMQAEPFNVPRQVVDKLQPLSQYITNVGKTRGNVPTASYVQHELNRLLGEADSKTYSQSIMNATKLDYDPGNITTKFPFGLATGTIGPSTDKAPVYYTPSRSMAPSQGSPCYFTPFCFDKNAKRVVLNLGNSLPTNTPGFDIATDVLGALTLVYFDQNKQAGCSLGNAVHVLHIPSEGTSLSDIVSLSAGLFDATVDESLLPQGMSLETFVENIATMPLGIIGTIKTATAPHTTILLQENNEGLNLRADQFVFRMNPKTESGATPVQPDTATVKIYATQFGEPLKNETLIIDKMDEITAMRYTMNTLGTAGTRGIQNISTPQKALTLANHDTGIASYSDAIKVVTNENGVAEFELQATDPGTPRGSQDLQSQIYFIQYNFAQPERFLNFKQDVNDLVSVLVFSGYSIPDNPSWENCIKHILPQYGKLYPIMGRFALGDYDTVVKYADAIRTVLAKPVDDPLHMPVVRDLSYERTRAILQWFEAGAPKGEASDT